jgi:acyl-CoA synthetase (NDP forming)
VSAQFADLTRLVNPRRVAVVGASDRVGSLGFSTYNNVRNNSRVTGGVFPVNPAYPTVFGDPAYARVSEIPGDPMDVVIVLVAAELVPEVVQDCAAAGVRHAVLLTSGFAETGSAGMALQARTVATARAVGMRIYGPNSPGLANVADGVLLSMSPVAGEDRISGPVGLVTQGGGIGRALMQWMDCGLGVGLWSSPGNEADLDVSDFVNHMVSDDRIKVIGAVIEGFSDGAKFIEAARRARQAGKPIVMVKIGRSEYGKRTAVSHTASIAGNDAVADAVFRQQAVIRVDDVDELGETLLLLTRAIGHENLDQACVLSFSGGTASLGADLVGAAGLTLAKFTPETAANLAERTPAFGFAGNPIDLTTRVFTDPGLNRAVLELVTRDPNVGSLIFAMPADYGESTVSVVQDALALTRDSHALFIPVWMSPRRGGGYALLKHAGVVPFDGLRRAVTALQRISAWCNRDRVGGRNDGNQSPDHSGLRSSAKLPDEVARDWFHGVPMRFPREIRADSPAAVSDAAQSIGGPVALKIVAEGLLHKTEVGGVRLGITSPAAAARAYSDMLSDPRLAGHQIDTQIVSVQEMIPPGLDVLIGAHYDEVFGPVITVGTGGVETEIERDALHLSIPFSDSELLSSLPALRLGRRLAGVRGAAAADTVAFCAAVQSFAAAFSSAAGQIDEIEINPLRVVGTGSGTEFVVLDVVALGRRRHGEAHPAATSSKER